MKKISKKILERKGATKVAAVPKDVLRLLNQGKIETKNLCEMLAVDNVVLYRNLLKEFHLNKRVYQNFFKKSDQKIMSQLRSAAEAFYKIELIEKDKKILNYLAKHPSDIARSFGVFMSGHYKIKSFEKRAQLIKPFAADAHMGVRECAWMVLRSFLISSFDQALPTLKKWASDGNPNIRRCAIESTRPRGVWCEHFNLLKQNPEKAESLISFVKSDPNRYVQNSVANWLNDASKDNPQYVQSLLKNWQKQSRTKETAYIIKRAGRSL